jgi:diguanylate cyclase (GGDEF)-like protein
MGFEQRFPAGDLPDLPHTRQLRAGFPWLRFSSDLEREYRRLHLEENVRYLRVNLAIGFAILMAFAVMDAIVLGHGLNRVPSLIRFGVIAPVMLAVFFVSFSARRHEFYAPITVVAASLMGLCVVAIQTIASRGGISILFPSLVLTTVYIYFLTGLTFYHALLANIIVLLSYLVAAASIKFAAGVFAYDAVALIATNVMSATVVYVHEKTSRLRFLEAHLLREMVARDGLTGIQNRRMFDQHIQRSWQLATRERQPLAVFLVDIDCFKNYNDRYGHQAGDECLRAVAKCLNSCARRPLDVVARYGGEEFALVLYQATREYVAEVLTRIQRSIVELNIPHEASPVGTHLTVSIGAAYVQPGADRTYEGLIQLADEALYAAKAQGRNRVVVMEAEYQNLKTGRFQLGPRHIGS